MYEHYDLDSAELHRRDPENAGLQRLIDGWHARLGRLLLARGLPTADMRVLDIGCGSGLLLAWFVQQGLQPQRCMGIDLMPDRVASANQRVPGATVVCADAAAVPAPDSAYDIVSLSMVVSSILDDNLARRVCREAARVVAPTGVIVWYDTRFPNPFNPNVRRVSKAAIGRLFPGFSLELESITLPPPLARRMTGTLVSRQAMLERIPLLRTRYIGLLSKRASR